VEDTTAKKEMRENIENIVTIAIIKGINYI
jgi:hypothetical protein